MILFWRRTDVRGLERIALTISTDEIVADEHLFARVTADEAIVPP